MEQMVEVQKLSYIKYIGLACDERGALYLTQRVYSLINRVHKSLTTSYLAINISIFAKNS